MNRLSALIVVSFVMNLVFASLTCGAAVDPKTFFLTRIGQYKIEMHGGSIPHGNSIASVEDLGDLASLTMGYCPDLGGFCDPGYLDFIYGSTKIVEDKISDLKTVFHISTVIEDRTFQYEWETEGAQIRFRNLQYAFPDGTQGMLEHVIEKIILNSTADSMVIEPKEFFASRIGDYKVELVAGMVPHSNNIGSVSDVVEEGGALVKLMYCDDELGFCDIGYRDFPYDSTVITQTKLSEVRSLYLITVNIDGMTRVYEWEEEENQVIFRSYNYVVNETVMPVLEHIMVRLGVLSDSQIRH